MFRPYKDQGDYGMPRVSLILQARKLDPSKTKKGVEFEREGDYYGFHVTDKRFIFPGNREDLPTFLGVLSVRAHGFKEIKINEKRGEWEIFGTLKPLRILWWESECRIPVASSNIYLVPSGEVLSISREPYYYRIREVSKRRAKTYSDIRDLEKLLE